MRLVRPSPVLALLATAFVLAACSENPVGRSCFVGANDAGPQETILASPALECQSRICLHLSEGQTANGSMPEDLCTAECSSDSDCDKSSGSPCPSGFTCIVPTTAGPFCCKKLCVCKDYLVIPEGGLPPDEACNPSLPQNECCNLSGRRANDELYPSCR